MKSSKKRDFSGKRMKLITVAIEEPILEDMVGFAPRESYGTIIEALVKEKKRRLAKKQEVKTSVSAFSVAPINVQCQTKEVPPRTADS